jgi:hypothetical protein
VCGGVLRTGEASGRAERPVFKRLRRSNVLVFSRESLPLLPWVLLLTLPAPARRTRQAIRSLVIAYIGHCISLLVYVQCNTNVSRDVIDIGHVFLMLRLSEIPDETKLFVAH